jgi:hypothetical protein
VTDTWPERCGIPTIQKTDEMLKWVMECLSEEDRTQEHAKQDLMEVRKNLRKIIQDLQTK